MQSRGEVLIGLLQMYSYLYKCSMLECISLEFATMPPSKFSDKEKYFVVQAIQENIQTIESKTCAASRLTRRKTRCGRELLTGSTHWKRERKKLRNKLKRSLYVLLIPRNLQHLRMGSIECNNTINHV